ncbi:MAG: hypothetical protein Q9186_001173 [Xanthomendoza sp. 1 TL-2023]
MSRILDLLTINLLFTFSCSSATAFPTSIHHNTAVHSRSPQSEPNHESSNNNNNNNNNQPSLLPRLELPADYKNNLFAGVNLSDPSSLLMLNRPTIPPRTTYHLILTSYHHILPANGTYRNSSNEASAALAPYYDKTATSIAGLIRQQIPATSTIAFGGSRVWLNFWTLDQGGIGVGASGEERGQGGLDWNDLVYVAERWKGFVRRGLVGKWDGVLWAPGRRRLRVEMRIL